MYPSRFSLVLLLTASVVICSLSQLVLSYSASGASNGPEPLKLNKVIKRELKGGERHQYQVVVGEGQYLHLMVEQMGIDVVLAFNGPDGGELLRLDTPNGERGSESLSYIAARAGNYQLAISSLNDNAQIGVYKVQVKELRRAQSNDILKIEQQQALIAATATENRASELMQKGRAAEAEPLLKEAVSLRQRVPGEPYISRPLYLLASAYEAQEKNELALQAYEKVLPHLEREEGKAGLSVGYTLYKLGRFYLSQGKPAKAELPLYRAVKLLESSKAAPTDSRMIAHQTLASLYRAQSRFSNAETHYLRALEMAANSKGGSESSDYVYLLNELGGLYLEQKAFARASEKLQTALEICDKSSFYHQLPIMVISNLTLVKYGQSFLAYTENKFDLAEELSRDGLELMKRVPDEIRENKQTGFLSIRAMTLNLLGQIYAARNDEKQKDSERAEENFRQALEICEKQVPEHPVTGSVLINLGSLLYNREEYAKAGPFLQRAVAWHRANKSTDAELLKAVYLLGKSYLAENNCEGAEPLLLESLRITAQYPEGAADVSKYLGDLYTRKEDFGQAEHHLQKALAFYEKESPYSATVAQLSSRLAEVFQGAGKFTLAESYYLRVLSIFRRNLPPGSKLTPAHISLTGPLLDLGRFYIKRRSYDRAEEIISELRTIVGNLKREDRLRGFGIGLFGAEYGLQGQFARGIALLQEALSYTNPGSNESAQLLEMLGSLYLSKADFALAEDCFKKALAIREAHDKDSLELRHSLHFLAEVYRQLGRYTLAITHAERILALYERRYGPDDIEVAKNSQYTALVNMSGNNYNRAETLLRRQLEIVEKYYGLEHIEVAEALYSSIMIYGLKGDLSGLGPQRARAVKIYEKQDRSKLLESSRATVLASLYMLSFNEEELKKGINLLVDSLARDELEAGPLAMRLLKQMILAEMYGYSGDFIRAEQTYKEALASAKQATGSPMVIQILKLLADFFANRADYKNAETYYTNALNVQKEHFGVRHPGTADLLVSLGDLEKARGEQVKPEEKYLEAIEIRTSIFGAASIQVGELKIKLADLCRDRGEYDRALKLYREALAIGTEIAGQDSLSVLNVYFGMGMLYRSKEQYDQAEHYFLESQKVVEKIYGKLTILSWATLIIPARMNLQNGEYVKAQRLLNEALAIKIKNGTTNDLSDSFLRLNLAETYRLQKDYTRAVSFGQEAVTTREKLLGHEHPETILALEGLADTLQAQGDLPAAVRLRTLAAERAEKNIRNFLVSGSERQKSQLLLTFNKSTDAIVSLHLGAAPDNVQAKRLALTTVLRRKGRALDVFSDQIASLRRRAKPEDQVLLAKLAEASAHWANLVFRSAAQGEAMPKTNAPRNFEPEFRRLEQEVQQLEAELSKHSTEFRNQTQPVTIEAVQAALPPEAALVEFIAYRPYNPAAIHYKNRFGSTRYAAYVVTHDSPEPGFVELGDAQSIDNQIFEWLELFGQHANDRQIRRAGNALYKKLFAPITSLLDKRRRVLLVPDGNLNLVQFAALNDDSGRYLIEEYDLSYLTSGRELLRLQDPLLPESVATVIANPAFDLTRTVEDCPQGVAIDNPYDLTRRCFINLPGTAQEAIEIIHLMANVKGYTEDEATEANLKKVNRPLLLHIATHGFFQPAPVSANPDRETPAGPADASKPGNHLLNPMLRSGLIMAGVKQGLSGPGENGVVTAQEMAGLNLLGTKLVVLSACKTGLGDAKNGEGVYGLRRALVLAGSETQIISLWKVSDEATRALMVAYYKRLKAGEGRVAAMRAVQLAMLRGEMTPPAGAQAGRRETGDTGQEMALKDYRHPYFWAAFIPSGEWRSLQGK